MYFQRLTSLMETKSLRPADVARAAHISRAAVSKWVQQGHKTGWVNVETTTLRELAHTLGVTISYFLEPLHSIEPMRTRFLWDSLYHSMENFISALIQTQPEALARLVQVVGLHDARAIIGNIVIDQFEQYKHCIHPTRREQLELLWPLYRSRN